ncbi:FKBP-type peptidyl-prolyl cis-trans isomerase [Canibacter zhoujuaniae]|uniref:FKBP-type peptidyl-prolyl cis-trans isomerase n=1 Tax=Canibacter zhoujuaniae TaxID=2708343 RepID=UPI00142014E2|nr:FKBP-type peptidyl-prolyl cis-trans isomerase [Canibacter zhoujuaniae]
MKRSLALVAGAATVLTLGACADQTLATGAGCVVPESATLKKIEVAPGEDGQNMLKGKLPITAPETQQVFVVEKGDGGKVIGDVEGRTEQYKLVITAYNGNTGKQIVQQPVQTSVGESSGLKFLTNVAGCVTDNGKLLTVTKASDVWPTADQMFQDLAGDDAVVLEVDYEGKVPAPLTDDQLLPQAEGKAAKLPADFPQVDVAKNGEPTITIKDAAAKPTELKVANLIEGDGETVEPGALTYVHYKGVLWSTGKEFDSSWSRGGKAASFPTDGVIEGFRKALEGQKVGSRVVVLVPPAEGYGADWNKQQGGTEDDVMVFVLDIVGAQNK